MYFKHIQAGFLITVIALSLAACSGLFDKDNTPEPTPLTHFTPELKTHRLWAVRTGSGSSDEYLKMTPTLQSDFIYTSSANGWVTAVNKQTGHIDWQTNTRLSLTAGPAANDQMIVVGSRQGEVAALNASTGALLWKTNINGEILAKPALNNRFILVKTTDGYLYALSSQDGHVIWTFKQTEPTLILRAASASVIQDDSVITGFSNGNLAKLNLSSGRLMWMQTIAIPEGAFSIQRMIDIDADPVLFHHQIYAATYQGKIASLDWAMGSVNWARDISSYTGMTAEGQSIYITDAKGHVWAFDARNGDIKWQQSQLTARILSAPANMDNEIVVGDAEGYLHWLNKQDGHFAAREFVGAAIYAAPLVDDHVVYAFTSNGYLTAYGVD